MLIKILHPMTFWWIQKSGNVSNKWYKEIEQAHPKWILTDHIQPFAKSTTINFVVVLLLSHLWFLNLPNMNVQKQFLVNCRVGLSGSSV